jgi:type II secretory pathway component GspD/PulD (secretin)
VNVLVAPGVNGLVTANFEQVTVEEAINAILKLCGLVALREANLLYVYSADDYPQADQFVRVFALDFCSAADLMPAVQGLLTKSGQAFVTEVSAENNRRTQEAIMVSDMPSALGRIEQYIIQMDQPPRQVMIEAHVLEIEFGSGCRHGIDYESLIKLAGGDIEVDIVGFADPLASPAAFARIKGGDLDSLLHIIKTTTDAKTLASPRLMVVNGQKARMQVGEQLGFKVITVTETASVEEVKFLDVGVVLEVTPQISRGNRVMLNVRPKVSTGAINPDTELPEEQTSELQTDVLLEDGEGVVIGGLIQETDVDVEKKLPVLGELYLIGWLFRKWEKTKKRTETIITLVPRVCVVDPEFEMRNAVDAERSRTPLLQGPLEPYPRPWEPVLPGTVRNPRPLWKSQHIPTVPSLNLKSVPSWDGQVGSPRCEKCNCETCICPPPAITPEPIADPDRASPLVVPAEEPDLRCSRLPTYRY